MNHLASSARQPGSLPLGARSVYALFRSPSQQLFFRFAKVFRGDRQSFFSRREERLCSPLLSKSTTFFRFVKLSFHREASRFLQSRGAVMLPSAFEVNNFFPFRKLSFHREAKSFSSIARSGYAPLRFRSQPLFSFPRKIFSLAFPLTVFPCREGGNCLKGPRKSSNKCIFLQNNPSISAQTGQQCGFQSTVPQQDARPCAGSFRPHCSSASGHPHSHCRCGRSSTRYPWPVRCR